MEISIAPRQEAFIRECLDTGRYVDASEIVREALRLFENQCGRTATDCAIAGGEMELGRDLRLQLAMDRMSRLMASLSNLLKKMSETAEGITQNLK